VLVNYLVTVKLPLLPMLSTSELRRLLVLLCRCAEYSSRIADLESRLTLSKRQAQMAMDKASKSCGFMKRISMLEDKVSSLTAKIVHLEECDSFLVGIVESACELLRCKFSCHFPLLLFCCNAAGP
jgi:hypothetical protein